MLTERRTRGGCGRRENGQSDCSSLSPWCTYARTRTNVCVPRSPFALDAHVASCFDDIKGISPNISCTEEPRTTYSSPSFHPFPPNASPSLPLFPPFHPLTPSISSPPVSAFHRRNQCGEYVYKRVCVYIYICTHAGPSVIEREMREQEEESEVGKMEDEDGNWRPLKPAAFPAIRTPHGSENLLS